ncbi:hypothetical protein EXS70_00105 [Candidatus Peribacteria bacterium]|nr:hypothetical protein [Candidatus Peribacteria bacterium]
MTQRHFIQSNQTLLITSITHHRIPHFQNPAFAQEAVFQIYRVQEHKPFFLYGFVVMPDHVHLLLHVPEPEIVSNVVRLYKMGLSFQMGIAPLWQKRFHSRVIDDIPAAQEYIHVNPVRAGISEVAHDYPWSSACGKWDISDIPWIEAHRRSKTCG